ncbi:MAG: hypothetical protein FWH12_05280 [Treponema sp.]|nr:hypothetical protein [Treponema sp.]
MKKLIFLFPVLLLTLTCRSVPPGPLPGLEFRGLEADNPHELSLHFRLDAANPFTQSGTFELASYRVRINGREASRGFRLIDPGRTNFSNRVQLNLRLEMDLRTLISDGLAPHEVYDIELIPVFAVRTGSAQPFNVEVPGQAVFPGVQAPIFRITSIAILRAELVNTRFRVGIRIDNPNPFPVVLSMLSYELYGNGMFWAEGAIDRLSPNRDPIPGNSAVAGNLYLLMNFIDMDRNLLDQFIYLQNVAYRFTGTTQVSTSIDYLPAFSWTFDLSGSSRVLDE